jgi:hypothetical protein
VSGACPVASSRATVCGRAPAGTRAIGPGPGVSATGIPAQMAAATAGLTPGTTSKGRPAAANAPASTPKPPASPASSRTTWSPAAA